MQIHRQEPRRYSHSNMSAKEGKGKVQPTVATRKRNLKGCTHTHARKCGMDKVGRLMLELRPGHKVNTENVMLPNTDNQKEAKTVKTHESIENIPYRKYPFINDPPLHFHTSPHSSSPCASGRATLAMSEGVDRSYQ